MPSIRAFHSLACAFSLLLACSEKGDDVTDGGSTSEPQATDSETSATQTTSEQPTDAQTTTTGTTDTTSDTDTGEPVVGCECAEGDPCSVSLCETAHLNEDEDTGGEDDAQLEFAVQCALEALRDRKVGRVGWRYSFGSGQFDERGHLEMFGDGTARYITGGVADLCEWVVDSETVVKLKEPAVFTDCLENASLADRFNCLQHASASTVGTCVEGETDCSGV